jgi:cytochrome P450
MLYAGHLTIPSTLLHLWRDLASSGTVTRVAAEADRVCASGLPEAASLTGSYCLAALKESMRVHPPAPLLYREVQHAFELGGFAFARDVSVWVCPQLLHHDARYFAEPHRFLPERFLHGRLPPAAEAVYLPFGTGPRTCIGNHQALHEMIVMTLRIARRFTMTQIGDGSTVFRAEARGGRSRGA